MTININIERISKTGVYTALYEATDEYNIKTTI